MNSQTFYLAKDGQKVALALVGLLIASLIFNFNGLALVFFLILLFWIFLFRNPERGVNPCPKDALLSPIDGEITQIQSFDNQTQICIKVGILDAGVLRAPIDIDVYRLSCSYGSPLLFSSRKSLFSPKTKMDFGPHSLEITQDFLHVSPIATQSSFVRGERMGFLKVGEVKLTIQKIELKVNVGDKLRSGESIIGYLQ